jgi:hypothetical protein
MADCWGGERGRKPDPSHGEAGCNEGGVQGALILLLLLLLPATVWYMAGPFVLPVLFFLYPTRSLGLQLARGQKMCPRVAGHPT